MAAGESCCGCVGGGCMGIALSPTLFDWPTPGRCLAGAHQEIDIHNPKTNLRSAGFTIEERERCGLQLVVQVVLQSAVLLLVVQARVRKWCHWSELHNYAGAGVLPSPTRPACMLVPCSFGKRLLGSEPDGAGLVDMFRCVCFDGCAAEGQAFVVCRRIEAQGKLGQQSGCSAGYSWAECLEGCSDCGQTARVVRCVGRAAAHACMPHGNASSSPPCVHREQHPDIQAYTYYSYRWVPQTQRVARLPLLRTHGSCHFRRPGFQFSSCSCFHTSMSNQPTACCPNGPCHAHMCSFNCRAKGIGWRLDYTLISSALRDKVCPFLFRMAANWTPAQSLAGLAYLYSRPRSIKAPPTAAWPYTSIPHH